MVPLVEAVPVMPVRESLTVTMAPGSVVPVRVIDAALEGMRIRRRPLFMTSLAFILGCVPLWIAAGAGAVGRQQLGTVVIMGMGFDTLFASLLIPVSFYAIERLSRRRETEPAPAQQPIPTTE